MVSRGQANASSDYESCPRCPSAWHCSGVAVDCIVGAFSTMALTDLSTPRKAKGWFDSSMASRCSTLDRNHFCRGSSMPGAFLGG